jgi:hypothetical protein
MTVNRHKYFRWTPRTTWLTFVYVIAVPATLGYYGYITEVSFPGSCSVGYGWERNWVGGVGESDIGIRLGERLTL